MAEVHSIREFHTELAILCTSFEVITKLLSRDDEDVEQALRPSLDRFRQLLDVGDEIAGPQIFPEE